MGYNSKLIKEGEKAAKTEPLRTVSTFASGKEQNTLGSMSAQRREHEQLLANAAAQRDLDDFKSAVDLAGLAFYPAAITGSLIDAAQGDYAGALMGLVPWLGRAGKHGKFWGQAYTKAVNAGVPHTAAYPIKHLLKGVSSGVGTGFQALDTYQDNPYEIFNSFKKGGVNSLEGDMIANVLMYRNRDKDFVNRAYALGANPGMFSAMDPDQFGQQMSHKMAWGEDDQGQAWMYPTVFNPMNEAIQVPNQYADYISSEGYKRATGMIKKNGGHTKVWTDKAAYDKAHRAEMDSLNKYKDFQKYIKDGWIPVTQSQAQGAKNYVRDNPKNIQDVYYHPASGPSSSGWNWKYEAISHLGNPPKKPVIHNVYQEPKPVAEQSKQVETPKKDYHSRQWNFNGANPVLEYRDKAGNIIRTETYTSAGPSGKLIKAYGGDTYSFDMEDYYRKGGSLQLRLDKRSKTSKNIKSSLNELLMRRNEMLFGPPGKRWFKTFEGGGENDNVPPPANVEEEAFNYLQALEQERARVEAVRANVAKTGERALDPSQAAQILKTKLVPIGGMPPFYCSTRSCELERAAGITVPADVTINKKFYPKGSPMPIIPGTEQWESYAPKLGYQKISPAKKEAGDRVFALADGQSFHSLIYAGKNEKGEDVYYNDHGSGHDYGKDYSYWRPGSTRRKPEQNVYRYVGNIPEYEAKFEELRSQIRPEQLPMKKYLPIQQEEPELLTANISNTMTKKSKKGGQTDPEAFPQQPTGDQLFRMSYIPQTPVGFYAFGGQSDDPKKLAEKALIDQYKRSIVNKDTAQYDNTLFPTFMVDTSTGKPFVPVQKAFGGSLPEAFPQQPTEHAFFAGQLWNPEYRHGGMPCMECGGSHMDDGGQFGGVVDDDLTYFKKGGNWIQSATASIKRRGTEGVCTGSKFGGPDCPPGSKRYNLAKTFRAMAKKEEGGSIDATDQQGYLQQYNAQVKRAIRNNLQPFVAQDAANAVMSMEQNAQANAMQYAAMGMETGMINPQNTQRMQMYQDEMDQLNGSSRQAFGNAFDAGMNMINTANPYMDWSTDKKKKGGVPKAKNGYELAQQRMMGDFPQMSKSTTPNIFGTSSNIQAPGNTPKQMTPQEQAMFAAYIQQMQGQGNQNRYLAPNQQAYYTQGNQFIPYNSNPYMNWRTHGMPAVGYNPQNTYLESFEAKKRFFGPGARKVKMTFRTYRDPMTGQVTQQQGPQSAEDQFNMSKYSPEDRALIENKPYQPEVHDEAVDKRRDMNWFQRRRDDKNQEKLLKQDLKREQRMSERAAEHGPITPYGASPFSAGFPANFNMPAPSSMYGGPLYNTGGDFQDWSMTGRYRMGFDPNFVAESTLYGLGMPRALVDAAQAQKMKEKMGVLSLADNQMYGAKGNRINSKGRWVETGMGTGVMDPNNMQVIQQPGWNFASEGDTSFTRFGGAKYRTGGPVEDELTDEEIAYIRAMGGQVEFLD